MADTQVQANDQAMDVMADEGRVTDDVMAHLTHGEIVIPLSIAHNKKAAQMIAMMFELAGEDISQFIVGSPYQKINPKTGHPEFWGGFFSSVFNAVAAPIKTAANTVSNVASTVADTVSNVANTAANTVSNVAKDVINLDPVAAVKDTVGGANTAINQTVSGTGTAVSQLASGATQTLKDAVTGVRSTVAATMDAVGLLPHAPSVNSPSGSASSATITQGDQNQRQQSVTDVQAAAGGGASSLTPRTVAGPDNDYKLNKSAVLGL